MKLDVGMVVLHALAVYIITDVIVCLKDECTNCSLACIVEERTDV